MGHPHLLWSRLSSLMAAGPPSSHRLASLCAVPSAPGPKHTKRLALAPCQFPGWPGGGEGVWMHRWESGRKGAATPVCINPPLALPSASTRTWGWARRDLT